MCFAIFQGKKTPFQAIKKKSLKSQKIAIFPKGLTHGFGTKMAIFPILFLGKIGQENVFCDILEQKKMPFQTIKTRRSKSGKIDIFPKGLTHRFGPKMDIFFLTLFLGNIGKENMFYDILERKNAFLGYKKQKLKKAKNCHFLNFFFLGNIGQENVFYDILERKDAFLGFKNKKFKKSKNSHFSTGVNPWLWSKNGHFSNFFFLGKIGQENVSYDILERKNTFLGYKKRRSKSPKIAIFPKGSTHYFGPKIAIYPTYFFQVKEIRKMSFTTFQKEKTPIQGIKTRRSKSRKIAIFPTGLTHSFGPKMAILQLLFFLGKIGQENVFYYILQRKNAFLGNKKKKLKKRKNCHFSKRVNPWFWSKNGHFFKLLFIRQYRPGKNAIRHSRTKKRLSRL